MDIEQVAYEEASGEMLDYFSKEQLARYLERCLSKLAEHGEVPYAWDSESMGLGFENHYSDAKPLYTEAQYLAAQQRAAEALVEPMAKVIYRQWGYMPEYTAWVDGGNSFKQDDARRIARNVVKRGEWRKYL